MKTSELTGAALDWAVAKCEGRRIESPNGGVYWPELCHFSPSTTWLQCGQIISREGITLQTDPTDECPGAWSAYFRDRLFCDDGSDHFMDGPTPLVAACRCYVASKMGDEVDVPEELK